jgi:hypothetical protein
MTKDHHVVYEIFRPFYDCFGEYEQGDSSFYVDNLGSLLKIRCQVALVQEWNKAEILPS